MPLSFNGAEVRSFFRNVFTPTRRRTGLSTGCAIDALGFQRLRQPKERWRQLGVSGGSRLILQMPGRFYGRNSARRDKRAPVTRRPHGSMFGQT